MLLMRFERASIGSRVRQKLIVKAVFYLRHHRRRHRRHLQRRSRQRHVRHASHDERPAAFSRCRRSARRLHRHLTVGPPWTRGSALGMHGSMRIRARRP